MMNLDKTLIWNLNRNNESAEMQRAIDWWNNLPMQDIIDCKNGWANLVMAHYPTKSNCQDVTKEEILYMYEQEH